MGTPVVVISILAAAALAVLAIRKAVSIYLSYRHGGVVQCPENHESAGIGFRIGQAVWQGLLGGTRLRLSSCSRWPERQDCGQACLQQIAETPQDCLVRQIVARWYQGKACAYCGKPIAAVEDLDHQPALLSPDQKTVPWPDIAATDLPGVLNTYRPVCWHCHVTTTIIREHPELVVDRSRTAKT